MVGPGHGGVPAAPPERIAGAPCSRPSDVAASRRAEGACATGGPGHIDMTATTPERFAANACSRLLAPTEARRAVED